MTRRLLTFRQRQVITLAANGYTNSRIARQLGITPRTVNSSLRLAYRNLGADNRTHAVSLAIRYEEINQDDIRLPDIRPAGTRKMVDQPRKAAA